MPVIARLRDLWTWLRYTYPFQLAHGPLCRRFREDVVRLGRLHVCRSCLALYGTLIVALPVVLLWAPGEQTLGWALGAVATSVAAFSRPPRYKRLPRPARDVVRAGAGVWIALAAAALLSGFWLVGVVGLTSALVSFLVFSRVRRRHRTHACDGCPELGRRGVCSGFRRQAVHVRAYEDLLTRRIAPDIAAELEARHAREPSVPV